MCTWLKEFISHNHNTRLHTSFWNVNGTSGEYGLHGPLIAKDASGGPVRGGFYYETVAVLDETCVDASTNGT